MGFSALFLAALSSPRRFFQSLMEGKRAPNYTPAVIAMLGSILAATTGLLLVLAARGGTGRTLFSILGLAFPLLTLLFLVFKSSIFHLFTSLWGTPGSVGRLVLCLLYSFLPFALLLPVALLLRAAGMEGLFLLAFVAVMIYSYSMEVAALTAVYGLSRGRALALFLLPLLVQVTFILVIFLGFLSVFTGLFLKGMGVF